MSDISVQFSLEGRGSFSASGPHDLVFKALKDFVDLLGGASALSPSLTEQAVTQRNASEAAKQAPPDRDGAAHLPPLAPYVKEKGPKTNPEAVTVMTVWDHLKNGTVEWTNESITALWRNSGRPKPGNLGRDIDTAVKSGWLDRPERGKYRWTQFGQDFVEDQLPREAKKS